MNLNPGKIKDPLVVRWVLERIKNAGEIDDRARLDELALLFNDRALIQIVETGDRDLVASLFMNLPVHWLIPIRSYLLENWLSWKGSVAYWSAARIAVLAPQEFCSVLLRYADSPGIVLDGTRLAGALLAVANIGKDAAQIAKILLARVVSEGNSENWWRLLSEMVLAAASCGLDEAVAMLARGFKTASGEYEKHCLEAALSAAYERLAPNLPYFAQSLDTAQADSDQSFELIPELFESGAPLKAIDRAMRAKGKRMLAAARELLPKGTYLSKAAGFAGHLALAAPGARDKFGREMLACFFIASTAAHHAKKTFAFGNYDLAALLGIASYDVADLPCYRETLDALKTFQREELSKHMPEALLKARDHYGGVHLTAMMGDLRYPEFVDPLIDCIEESARGDICECAQTALAKIGDAARQAIMSRWNGFDASQRIYGYGVLERTGGDEKTVQFLRERFGEVRLDPGAIESWCAAAEAVPHRELLQLLEGELHRELYAVDDSYSTICAVLGIDSPALKGARRRVKRHTDRILDKPLDEITVEDVMDLPGNIELRCSSCGESNQFPMPCIYINPEKPEDGFCIGGDLTCPSCQSFGPFEPEKMATIAVMAELMKLNMAKAGLNYRGPIRFMKSSLHDGRVVSPVTALKEYRERVERNPASVPDLLGLGNVYNYMDSWKLAADCYRRCLAAQPECVEAAHSLAEINLKKGDPDAAFKLLENAWQLRDRWRFHRLRTVSKEDFISSFIEFYDEVAQKTGSRKLSLGVNVAQASTRKVGRNDPCPCGSGKKYKKCCGQRIEQHPRSADGGR